jgi:hypothetical protein
MVGEFDPESEAQAAVWNQFVRKDKNMSEPLSSGQSDIVHLPKLVDSTNSNNK